MRKLFIFILLILVSCSPIKQEPLPQVAPTKDMSSIKLDQQYIDHIIQIGYFAEYEGYNLFRTYDPEAGVVCWFIFSAPGAPINRDVGLGCLPIEETRLFR